MGKSLSAEELAEYKGKLEKHQKQQKDKWDEKRRRLTEKGDRKFTEGTWVFESEGGTEETTKKPRKQGGNTVDNSEQTPVLTPVPPEEPQLESTVTKKIEANISIVVDLKTSSPAPVREIPVKIDGTTETVDLPMAWVKKDLYS